MDCKRLLCFLRCLCYLLFKTLSLKFMLAKRVPSAFLVLILFVNLGGSAARGDVAPRVASPGASVNSSSPLGAGLKGLQVQMIDDAIKLGIKHAALNVSLTSLIDLDAHPDTFHWKSGGRKIYFSPATVDRIPVLPLSTTGARAYLILLSTVTTDPRMNRIVRRAAAREVPNAITGFNLS